MDESTAVASEPVATSTPGPDAPAGQASGTPAAADNQPTAPATPAAQAPASTPRYRFKDQAEAERAHSELQSRYSRVGDPDQAASRLALLGQLQRDPKFVEWAKARLAEQDAGAGDPETVKALQIVESVAERKARELVAPLAAQAAQVRLAAVFQAMESKHGPEWKQYQPKMAELFRKGVEAGYFSPMANTHVSLEFVDGLYKMATGDDPDFAAKAYQKRLAAKHATSTQATPGAAANAVASGPVQSIEAAFAAAKRQHGLA
jgi:hypothetical protein